MEEIVNPETGAGENTSEKFEVSKEQFEKLQEIEKWKDILGYEGKYQISNLGRLKSLINKNGKYKVCIKKLFCANSGYIRVNLYKNSIRKTYSLHRLVAETFIKNIENKLEVNHINGIKTDNRIENLEWCSKSENMLHCFRQLNRNNHLKTNHPSLGKKFGKHFNSKKIKQLDKKGNLIKIWESINLAALELGIKASSNISSVCKGNRNFAGGFKWEYLN